MSAKIMKVNALEKMLPKIFGGKKLPKMPKVPKAKKPLPQDKYVRVKMLQSGVQGSAYLYRHIDTDDLIVIKFANNIAGNDDIRTEKKIYRHLMRKLSPECKRYFPKFYDFKGKIEGTNAFLALEYLTGTTLYDKYIYDISTKKRVITAIQAGIKCMWKAGVIHNDLHAKNIMVTRDNRVKLIDFGASQIFSPLKNKNVMNVWFNNKHQKSWNKSFNGKSSVPPSNPNSVWFGYNKPMWATSHKRLATKLLKNTSMYVKKPYESKQDLKKLARLLGIKDASKMTKSELSNKVYSIDNKRLIDTIVEYYSYRGRNNVNFRFTPNLYKKLLNYR